MTDKIKYDSFLNGVERALAQELGKDQFTDRKMFDYTMKIVDHFVKLYGDESQLPEDLSGQVERSFFENN